MSIFKSRAVQSDGAQTPAGATPPTGTAADPDAPVPSGAGRGPRRRSRGRIKGGPGQRKSRERAPGPPVDRVAAPEATPLPRAKDIRAPRLARWLGLDRIEDRSILSSTRQAEALNVALVETHRPMAGPPTGVDARTGNAASNDPHALYTQKPRRITSPNVVVLGDVGSGKSSLVKTVYVGRAVATGKQVAVFDRKDQQGVGEYLKVSRLVGGTTVRFARGRGGTAVNLLDPRIATRSQAEGEAGGETVGQDRLLLLAAQYAHGPLTSQENHALRAAHRAAVSLAKAEDRVATLHDVIDALFNPSSQAVPREALSDRGIVDVDTVTEWGLSLAMDLERFVHGDLSGLVDAETSDDVDWESPLLVFDTSELDEDSPALSLVMALVSTFLSSVWAAQPGRQRIIVLEEGYHTTKLRAIEGVSVAGILRSLVKRGRGIGLAFVTVVHHCSDIPLESDAMSLIREAQVIHCFKQSRADDRATVCELFDFPPAAADLLAVLDEGQHIMKIGAEAPRMVNHIRTTAEVAVTGTDEAMAGHTETAAQL